MTVIKTAIKIQLTECKLYFFISFLAYLFVYLASFKCFWAVESISLIRFN